MAVTAKRTGTKVITGKVRLSYVNIFEPHSTNGGEPKYSVSLIIPKTDKLTVKAIKEAIEEVKANGKDKWGGKVPPNLKSPLRDGDTEKDDENYANSYFINANSSKVKPEVVDAKAMPIFEATEVYSGCYGRVSINFYAYNSNGNKGIACGLGNVQKLSDGEPLGGFSRAEDDFDTLEEDEDGFMD